MTADTPEARTLGDIARDAIRPIRGCASDEQWRDVLAQVTEALQNATRASSSHEALRTATDVDQIALDGEAREIVILAAREVMRAVVSTQDHTQWFAPISDLERALRALSDTERQRSCVECGRALTGHKQRVLCKECSDLLTPATPSNIENNK